MQDTRLASSGNEAERAGLDYGQQMKRLAEVDRREAALRRELARAMATVELAEREVERLSRTLVRRETELADLQQDATAMRGETARLTHELQQIRRILVLRDIEIAALKS